VTPEQWPRTKQILEPAWERDGAERSAFLDQACADDPQLRSAVDLLLASDENASEFMAQAGMAMAGIIESELQSDGGAVEGVVMDALSRAIQQLPGSGPEDSGLSGTRIGRYTIQRLIGKGGMGAVYQAGREDDFHMQAAIKLLKRGTDTDTALSRFRTERQILAGLQHPNIARLIDGGATEDGLPYLVMEYVDGLPLLEYAAPLSVRERISLFHSVSMRSITLTSVPSYIAI
jgi:serine/threonine-protein kinase